MLLLFSDLLQNLIKYSVTVLKRERPPQKEIKHPLQISTNCLKEGTCISLTVVYANRIRGINILEGADICPDILNREHDRIT